VLRRVCGWVGGGGEPRISNLYCPPPPLPLPAAPPHARPAAARSSFEGAISALGAPLVGIAAQSLFGFTGTAATAGCGGGGPGGGGAAPPGAEPTPGPLPAAGDLDKAEALGNALLLFTAVPWALCAVLYSGLHWTYPGDRRRAAEAAGARALVSAGGAPASAAHAGFH